MPIAFITGATGFIGGHMVRRLCGRGFQVRALVRPSSCYNTLKSFQVELVKGDLSQFSVIRDAMSGCDTVFHTAADYRLWTKQPSEMYAANVEGTRNVMQAAWDLDIEKVVYTSTVGTIGLNGCIEPSDETSFLQFDSKTGHYKKSKFMAEQEALRFAKRGLPVVIVNPSAPVGSHDWKPTPTGRLILDFLNRRMPMYFDTGLNMVDVEDVAEGHLLALEKGRAGERYILGNENLSLKQILILLSEITGIPVPGIRCPYLVALAAAWGSEAITWLGGAREPRIPREGVYMARNYMYFDSQKAVRELGFRPGTVQSALRKAVMWFLANGYVKKSLPSKLNISVRDVRPSPSSIVNVQERAVAMAE